jgi:hypothetical protein
MHIKFESKVLKERLYLGDLGADNKIILKRSVKKRGMRMCIGSVCHWRALVNTLLNFRVRKKLQISWPAERLLGSAPWRCIAT